MRYKRVTLLSGHYGSGKTNIAVNFAMDLRKQYEKVAIADLDIVNPYYRSVDSREMLEENGIRIICSEFANTNVDFPALPQEIYSIVDDRETKVIIDVGGDERGALALGRIADAIREENDFDMFLVVNRFRPLTPDVDSTVEVMLEIEDTCKLSFTGIINDSNLGPETTAEIILNSRQYGLDLSQKTGLPLCGTAVEEKFIKELEGKIPDLIPMRLQRRPIDEEEL